MVSALAPSDVTDRLARLEGWSLADDKLYRQLIFKDFSAAWDFMSAVALLAEQLDHHPEWSNVYNRVEIALTTHDAGGISERDFDLARLINQHLDQ